MPASGTAALETDTLESEALELELLPGAGARLHRLRVFGQDVLRTPATAKQHLDDPFYWGAFHMLPWANRIDAGPRVVGGRTVNVAANFKDGTAIHGLHYASPWTTEAPGVYSATGGGDRSGWPWPYRVSVAISLDGTAVGIRHEVVNLADEPMPAGAGIHPWFVEPIDVRISARLAIASNTDPHAPHEPVFGNLDLRDFAELQRGSDTAWTDLTDPGFDLRWSRTGLTASVRTSAYGVYVVAANPGGLGAVAVEPQTHAPWGMRRLLDGERGGLIWLEPGTALTLDTEFSFRSAEKEQT